MLSERKRLFPYLNPPVLIAPLCIHHWLRECITILGEDPSNDNGMCSFSPTHKKHKRSICDMYVLLVTVSVQSHW